ncbi:hypothetical protein FRC04_006216 [Tulasnella sp. 424]|nr:hypothetical protein FRC04_006216 [Tulasnella sp. 424]
MPLKVGPPSVFMTGMESPFTPSPRVTVEGESSTVVVDQGVTAVQSSSATRKSFSSSSSEIRTSSSSSAVETLATTLKVDGIRRGATISLTNIMSYQ